MLRKGRRGGEGEGRGGKEESEGADCDGMKGNGEGDIHGDGYGDGQGKCNGEDDANAYAKARLVCTYVNARICFNWCFCR